MKGGSDAVLALLVALCKNGVRVISGLAMWVKPVNRNARR